MTAYTASSSEWRLAFGISDVRTVGSGSYLLDGYYEGELPRILPCPAARLQERRRDLLGVLTEPEAGFTVVAYALTTANAVPTHTLARVRAYAAYQGWRVHAETLWDGCGMTHPLERTDWQKAERLVASGFAHGIVTLDQSAVSTNTCEYLEVLDRLQERCAFLAHVPHEWRRPANPPRPPVQR
ncbi:hypothetical protein NLX86_30005 [Streptomyces sp. A3M-1-3]|uniref:hypothetical protein n=1 Tax=Streptomyces sp. A3M-1-3 TaxID=2962044 RepID=UPI0020B89943|nr:hypothetical protein [Streptomyces sp. A3M-1-3]MCP3822173.1 hypothetical protein [Streptomyces sp. A3M-1-3]